MTTNTNGRPPEAVYIHIPFCTNKCFYCDFNSYVLKDQPVMDYLEALDRADRQEHSAGCHQNDLCRRWYPNGAETR